MIPHGFTQADRAEKVIIIIFKRHLNTFPYGLQACKVYGTGDGMSFKNAVQRRPVTNIFFVESDFFPGNLLNAVYRLSTAVDKVIDNHDVIATV